MATAIGERLNSYTQTRGFGGNLESDNNFQRQQSDVNNLQTNILILSSRMDMMKTLQSMDYIICIILAI